ncbi:sodium/calcium exchanger NCL2-like [Mangifera indica]|uniref:sodium/calcium exchanger NCL2-like n=1 Tax=Mangifera indica TaxID=29780 RepID=UPI001CF98CC7|nr:sodium/calcium exchanger NCL2-like [Mangifera indica]
MEISKPVYLVFRLLALIIVIEVSGRPTPASSSAELISDGGNDREVTKQASYLPNDTGLKSETQDCKQMYASELLNSKDEAKDYVHTGVGLLAGSSIWQLTVIWGTCVILGSQVLHTGSSETNYTSLSNGTTTENFSLDTPTSKLTDSGITTDKEIKYIARIMFSSLTPFLIIQLLKIAQSSYGQQAVMLIDLFVTLVFLFLYFFYQIFQRWIQQRRLELFEEIDRNGDGVISPSELREVLLEVRFSGLQIDKEKVVAEGIKEFDIDGDQKITKDEFGTVFTRWLDEAKNAMDKKYHSQGGIMRQDGTLDKAAIRRLFEKIDLDGNNFISQHELKELMVNIKFGKVPDEAVAKPNNYQNMIEMFVQKTWEETDKLVDDENSIGVVEDKSKWAWLKAIMYVVIGIAMLSVLAEPLIYSVENFSNSANIPSFFISFILVPLATNFRAATSVISAAYQKKPRTTSLIYGGVFMNNVLGYAVLLSLIYFRGITWEYSAELLAVVTVCSVMGAIASFRSTFPVWISVIAILLYPLSSFLVYLLNDVLSYV